MADNKRPTPDLLPSPWTDFTPLRNPFSYNQSNSTDSERGSPLTSATSSPTCSPTSSPISATRSHPFSPYFRRGRSRERNSFTSRSPSSFRLSSLFLRRRPSAVDLALSEERSRCSEDEIERRGLGLMEPRPVDPMPVLVDIDEDGHKASGLLMDGKTLNPTNSATSNQPRYVMGGIFEVMEGSA
ncbi:predicted protein [Uncinocarpus reesii 1704]|uniref:Uncharacterized protein n=1 Tax=Uncinocarpus reesii (strain UAMH 1704) TaxID=336963 RepID=C4JTW2_UNCRE|nr:uncharacterized protein UREG_05901 [Uncinocarpus reesii 1704]EEP81059.1 predicted protein [Uncinocarpus reesii 1704]